MRFWDFKLLLSSALESAKMLRFYEGLGFKVGDDKARGSCWAGPFPEATLQAEHWFRGLGFRGLGYAH